MSKFLISGKTTFFMTKRFSIPSHTEKIPKPTTLLRSNIAFCNTILTIASTAKMLTFIF